MRAGPGALGARLSPPAPVQEAPAYAPDVPAAPGSAPHGRHRRAPEKQASYREVFAIREFRGLWTAQVLSYAGDQFAQVAIAVLVYHRTGSALLTALARCCPGWPTCFRGAA